MNQTAKEAVASEELVPAGTVTGLRGFLANPTLCHLTIFRVKLDQHPLAPELAGVITVAFGIALVGIAAIPVLQKIAITCAFWSISTVAFGLIFTPIMLAVLPASRRINVIIEQSRAGKSLDDRMIVHYLVEYRDITVRFGTGFYRHPDGPFHPHAKSAGFGKMYLHVCSGNLTSVKTGMFTTPGNIHGA